MKVNIASRLSHLANNNPFAEAVVTYQKGLYKSYTFKQLNDAVNNYSHILTANGIKKLDRIMLMIKPGFDFMAISFALFRIGATAILIDPGMGFKNLRKCIAHVKPQGFIGIPLAHLFKLTCPKTFKTVTTSLCVGNSLGFFGNDITKITSDIHIFNDCAVAQNDLAAIVFTTGSTGPPKGVEYPHRVFNTQLDFIKNFYKITSDDIDQPGFPLFGLFAIALGASAVIPDMDAAKPAQVDPVKFITSIKNRRVTYSFGSPAIWDVISNYCIENNIVLDSIRLILMAGAPISGELITRVQKIIPKDAQIHTPYGATESLPSASIEGKEITDETWQKTCQGSGTCVGKALPNVRIEIIKATENNIAYWDDNLILPTGEIGEIVIKGDMVTPAYYNNPQETKKAKIKDGAKLWHRIGDMGYKDTQGRLWFCGRKAHRVITKNKIMYTIPCEAPINTHKSVKRTALVGIGDTHNQEPALIVEPINNQIDGESLLKEIANLAKCHPLTKDIKHFLIHPNFPVDIRHNAKIFREKLKIWAEQELS